MPRVTKVIPQVVIAVFLITIEILNQIDSTAKILNWLEHWWLVVDLVGNNRLDLHLQIKYICPV